MRVSLLTEKEISKYGLRQQRTLIGGKERMIGCKAEEELLAYATVGKLDESVIIRDFYVREDSRGKGVGAALLDTICSHVMAASESEICVDYAMGEENSLQIQGMLFRRGFRMRCTEIATYEITKAELADSYLAKMEANPIESKAYVFPLQVVTANQLKELIYRNEEMGNYLISRADYLGADRKRSKVLLSGDRIVGVILLEDTEEVGTTNVSLLYIEPRYLKKGFLMLKEAFDSLMEPGIGVKKLRFVCMNYNARRLAEFLFPKGECVQRWYARGILKKELYQKRG